MRKLTRYVLTFFTLFLTVNGICQKETWHWYFGYGQGLDFSGASPTYTTGSMSTLEGCASISDSNGNLLFYTDGITVYDRTHSVMANGTGLMGNASSAQAAIIVKQPGNTNIYYVFTTDCCAQPNGLRYSVVDMNLAAGLGSVTIQNTLIQTPNTEKLVATSHCNGRDVWVVTHDLNTSVYRSFLLTSAGLSNTAVTSTAGIAHTAFRGQMKISANGLRIASALESGAFDVGNFDNSTGMVSSVITLTNTSGSYGCEFSPDGSKLYGCNWLSNRVMQWNLCAGSTAAVIASTTTLAISTPGMLRGQFQLAPDGKIYHSKQGAYGIDVINNPNLTGTACNFVANQISTGTYSCGYGLPNFVSNYVLPKPQFVVNTVCGASSFTAPSQVTTTFAACAAPGYVLPTLSWNFGDPASGAANSSTLATPTHSYSSNGVYTVHLILGKACGNDTIKQVLNISSLPSASLSVTKPVICIGETSTISILSAGNFTWNTGSTSNNLIITPTVSSVYSATVLNSGGSCPRTYTTGVQVSKCTYVLAKEMNARISVYPNPFTNSINVMSDLDVQITIIDQRNVSVFRAELSSGDHILSLDNLDAGLYFVSYRSAQGSGIIKLVKLE